MPYLLVLEYVEGRMRYFPVAGETLGEADETGGDFEMAAAKRVDEWEVTQ